MAAGFQYFSAMMIMIVILIIDNVIDVPISPSHLLLTQLKRPFPFPQLRARFPCYDTVEVALCVAVSVYV